MANLANGQRYVEEFSAYSSNFMKPETFASEDHRLLPRLIVR